jgi:antitoxin (DNA-binding transcriptional repressor) of toxin-antitoxin stability system
MNAIPVEEADGRLSEIIAKLTPGEEIMLLRNEKPVAKLIAIPSVKPRPLPGRGKGMLTIISDDEEHLEDFAEYMP